MCQWLMPRAYTEHHLPVTADDKVTVDERSQPRASREPHLLFPWIRRGHWHQITAQDTDRHWFPLPQTRRCQWLTYPRSGHTQTLAFHYHEEGSTNVLRKHSPVQTQTPTFLLLRVTTSQWLPEHSLGQGLPVTMDEDVSMASDHSPGHTGT